MKEILSASEAVELGIQIEKNGYDFYSILSRKINDPVLVSIFDLLAKEEEKHIAVFRKILDGLDGSGVEVGVGNEYLAYMSSISHQYVFTENLKGREIAQKISTALESIDLGIGFEKDSIIFYQGIETIVPMNEKGIVSELILQEEKHLKRLLDFKNKFC